MLKCILPLIIIALFLCSCSDLSDLPFDHPANNSNLSYRRSHYSDSVTVKNFPRTVGSWWMYKHIMDPGYPRRDSEIVTFNIVGKTITSEGFEKLFWLRDPGHVIDTMIFRNDTVFTQGNRLFGFDKKYIFPLTIGSRWATTPFTEVYPQYVYYYDSSKVLSRSALTVSNKTFGNAYLIYSDSVFVPGIHGKENRWFVPQIGVVKMNMLIQYPEGIYNESWELLSYDVGRRSK